MGHRLTIAISKSAVEGSLNIIRQAAAVGIKKIVVTSSLATVRDSLKPESVYSDLVLTDEGEISRLDTDMSCSLISWYLRLESGFAGSYTFSWRSTYSRIPWSENSGRT